MAKESAARRRIANGHSEVTAIMLGYKRHAKDRGLDWALSRQEFEALIARPCFYCASPPGNIKKHKNTISPLAYSGVDRADNGAGYVVANVVPCCVVCNRAKRDMPQREFLAWLAKASAQWGALDMVKAA